MTLEDYSASTPNRSPTGIERRQELRVGDCGGEKEQQAMTAAVKNSPKL